MLYVLFAGLDGIPSLDDAEALKKLLPFLTGERLADFEVHRISLHGALTQKRWYDYTYILASNLYDAQDSFVEAMDLMDFTEELLFLVKSDEGLKWASGNRVYSIPSAAIWRFNGSTSLPQAARLLELVVAELTYLRNLPMPAVEYGDLFKTDSIYSGRRTIKSQGLEIEYHFADTKRQAYMSLGDWRLSLYAENIGHDEWDVQFQFSNYGSALPPLVSCVVWDWLLQNTRKAYVSFDDETAARIQAGVIAYDLLTD